MSNRPDYICPDCGAEMNRESEDDQEFYWCINCHQSHEVAPVPAATLAIMQDMNRIKELEARIAKFDHVVNDLCARLNIKTHSDAGLLFDAYELLGTEILPAIEQMQSRIRDLKADYGEMRSDLCELYNLEGARSGSSDDDTRQIILNKWK